MESTKSPLRTWLLASYFISHAKNGISALELMRHLGVSYSLNYVIANRKTGVVETGRFTVAMSLQEQSKERNFSSIQTDNYCEGERETISSYRTNFYSCRAGYYYKEKIGICPDGSKHKISRRKVFNY